MKMKKILAVLVGVSMMTSMVVGCGKTESQENKSDKVEETTGADGSKVISDIETTITWASYAQDISQYNAMGLEEAIAEYYPNVTIEFEEFKDSGELLTALKVRASANELPDIVLMQASELANFEDYYMDLSDLDSAAKNTVAGAYSVNDKILGLPTKKSEATTIIYWKEMFEKAGITELPTTWPAFVEVCDKVQATYGKDDKNFTTFCMGALDEWATYPFTEFLPATINKGNGDLWNDMASVDEPFTKGCELYEAYNMVYDFFKCDYFGPDPLGVGYDQTTSLFYAKQASMVQANVSIFLSKAADAGVDTTDVGAFYLPTRDTEDDCFNLVTQGNGFLSVSTSCKNPDVAKGIIDTFFSEEVYPKYLDAAGTVSAIEGIEYEYEQVPMQEAIAALEGIETESVVLLAGKEDYKALEAEVEWNFKKLGTQFFIKEFDFDGEMNRLNGAWSEARAKLNIQ